VLSEGVTFDWESFPQYLDALAATPKVLDIGAQVPHGALRFYVMGERGADLAEPPSPEEIESMGALLEEALRAGALGFTTSRTVKHRAKDGRFTPGLTAHEPELFGLARAMKRAGRGVIEVNSDFDPGEFEIMCDAARIAGRPLSCLLVQVDRAPDLWRETLAQIRAARQEGMEVNAQVGCRPIGVLMGLETSIHPFLTHPEWVAMTDHTPEMRYRRLQRDAELRRMLVYGHPQNEQTRAMDFALTRSYLLDDTLNYEPDPERSVDAIALAQNRHPWELALELMMRENGKALLLNTFENYSGGDLAVVHEMLTDDATVLGVADGGAHVGLICDASSPTFLLSHWARDRTRGPKLPLEFLVNKQTRRTALAYGLEDRGLLAPGFKADINVIDFEQLRLRKPEVVYDLPAGGKRLMQRAQGYRHTFVAGCETVRDGEHTGELPGTLLR
jgi:N-acyl-D-aspartate/D-glutamate deacylase